ncbi:hypothetical protein XENORESO_007981 [Xenotaenia resolanae]|uniref:Uncharacterized protein n=1 Tax=Xenotaenia resolanae TaxID=208358 RepID=A0ABV0X8X5_9TELE
MINADSSAFLSGYPVRGGGWVRSAEGGKWWPIVLHVSSVRLAAAAREDTEPGSAGFNPGPVPETCPGGAPGLCRIRTGQIVGFSSAPQRRKWILRPGSLFPESRRESGGRPLSRTEL